MYGISYANLTLYGAAIPNFSGGDGHDGHDGKKEPVWGGSLDYDNPDNFTDSEDRKRI